MEGKAAMQVETAGTEGMEEIVDLVMEGTVAMAVTGA